MCGADFPIQVSALGESGPLGYDDEAVRPPGSLPSSAVKLVALDNTSRPKLSRIQKRAQ